MPIVIQIGAREEIEWPCAVEPQQGRQTEIAKDAGQGAATRGVSWTFEKRVRNELMPLVEGRKGSLCPQVELVVCLEVGVIVDDFVDGLAQGVVPREAHMTRKAPANLERHRVIEGIAGRLVDIALKQIGSLKNGGDQTRMPSVGDTGAGSRFSSRARMIFAPRTKT